MELKIKIIFQPVFVFSSLIILINCTSCKHGADSLGITILDSTLTYKDFNYPKIKYPLISFSVMQPGIIMLPLQGGIYMPNFKTWYLKPGKEPLLSVSPDVKTGTLYYCKNLPNLSMILRVTKENNINSVAVVDTFPRGFYNVVSTGQNSYFVMGLMAQGYGIWQRKGKDLNLIFESKEPITAFSAIDQYACLICCNKKLLLLKKDEQPTNFGSMEIAADGIAVDGNGEIYLSSGNFIYRIISQDKFIPIAAGLHGYLQYSDGKLFVLWQEKSKVIAFDVGLKRDAQVHNNSSLNIGDKYGGGIIFYIDSTGKHGLIAAQHDLGGVTYLHAQYECKTDLGDDWGLPTKEELNKLYLNKNKVGGFGNYYYWSHTQLDYYFSWSQSFGNGYQKACNIFTDTTLYVRPVRAF